MTGSRTTHPAPLQQIPTNLITGFLGAGKTTAISHLLAHKPEDERWALLINEFGEVGIDGALLSGPASLKTNRIYLREVPGGCLCCANQLNLQIALNLLLQRSRPHRLLIEPTGLGHPRELLSLLQGEYYRDVLSLRSTLTLVDARQITDQRYRKHPTFKQQLEVADVIVASKSDLYGVQDLAQLQTFLKQMDHKQPLITSAGGELKSDLLDGPNHYVLHHHCNQNHTEEPAARTPDLPPNPECGYLRIDREGEGFYSTGWIFQPEKVFEYDKLIALLNKTPAIRLKGVFITDRGILQFNRAGHEMNTGFLDEASDSRIEWITDQLGDKRALEQSLTECLIT